MSQFYDGGAEGLLDRSIDLTGDVRVMLVASSYLFSAAHRFMADAAPGNDNGRTGALAGQTFTAGAFGADDTSVTATAGLSCDARSLTVVGSGGVSVGMSAGSLLVSGQTTAAQTVQTQNLVTVQGSTGAISFANANGITFGGNASGDPTHQWPPVSEWSFLYLNREWRDANAPHVGYTCNFAWSPSFSIDMGNPDVVGRTPEVTGRMARNNTNVMRDLIVTLTKVPGA